MNTYINKVFILLLMSFFTTALHAQYNPENPAEPGAPIVYYKLSLRATPSGAGTFNISTSTTHAAGANVSLRANSSNSEYVFVAWTENDVVVSTTSQFTYTMPAHHVELVAHFDYRPASPGEPSVPNIPVYSTVYLSCSPANSGSFNISSGNRYVVGTSVSITATNKTDFTFSHWTENDSTISTSKTLQYVVKESDAHLVAHFQYTPSSPAEPPVLQPTHRLTLQVTPSGSGSASGGGEYQPGTAITLKATAKTDYAFDAWLENGTVLSTASSYTYTMPDRDVTLTARFKVSYNPSNPSEPVFPTNERHNIFGMTENALQGQRILYPVYLENTTPLMNMYIDLTFPDGFVVDTANCSLSDRCNGNWLEKILVEGNMWRMRVRGTNTFIGANGNIMLIPVTVPDTAQMGKNYLVALSHGVIMRPDSTQIPVGVRSGYIYVTKTLEEGLYAQYTYEKLNGRVFFKNQSSDSAQTYIWEFGDGTFSTEFSPLHLYDNAGMYSVLLNSKGHVDTDIAEQTVIINDRDKWKLGGAFHLADSITSVRHFLSTQSLLDFLSDVAIAETNVTIFGQANAEHGMQLTDANIATLTKVHSLLSGSQYTISFTNDGLGTTAYAMGDANDTLTTDRISLFNNLGDITLCHNAITKLCGIEYNPWIIRQIPNQYVYVDNATSEIDLSVIGPNLQYSWQLVDTTWLTSGFIAGCVQSGTGNIPSMRIINKTGRLVDLTYQVQVRYGEWLFREFTKTFTIDPSPYEYLTPEYITLCYGDTCLWRDSAYVESGVYADTIGNEISTLHLTIRPEVPVTNDSVTICQGATYVWNGFSYSAEGEYSMTLQDINGCDSVAVLHLTVLPVPATEETAIACDSLSWNGQTYTQSGDYVYTTTAANGCDSIVTLHLTVHYSDTAYFIATACDSYEWHGVVYTQSGVYPYLTQTVHGCDSLELLNLTIHYSDTAYFTATACDSYEWHGVVYTQSGVYPYLTQTVYGCDSLELLNLTIHYSDTAYFTATACDSYEWHGVVYTQSGVYEYLTQTVHGCDSLELLNLTIHYSEVGATEYATICYGDTYTWNGQTYSTAGEYTLVLSNTLGCDSVATLNLTILPEAITQTETVVIGNDELPYLWRDMEYTTTGLYTDIEKYSIADCDSAIHVLDLTVLNTDNYEEYSVTICDTEAPYVWYEQSLTTSGKYTHIEKYAGTDIDSIQHILNLTVNPTLYAEYTATACDTYTWNNETFNTSGDYTQTFTAITGCDSIVTLHLTIHYSDTAYFTATACDSYEWHGVVYTQSGVYEYLTQTVHGCDSLELLDLTIHYSEVGATEYVTICYGETYLWNGQTYSTTGEYSITLSNTLGCDSVATLNLTILPEAVTTTESVVIGSNELPYTWRGQSITATGRYTDIEQYTTAACDSAIYVLDLTVLTTGAISEQSATICDTEAPYVWYEQSLTTSGKYTHIEKYAGTNIDSIQHILNLTVNPTLYTEYTATACDTYTWNNETYNTSGDYTQTFTAITGCDSIVTLHLTIHYSDTAYFTATACDSYEWHGQVYTQSGVYPYLTQTVHGCDSLELLDLTVYYSDTAYFTATACDSYEWHGVVYTQSGVYPYLTQTVHGCDSLELLDLTIHYSDTAYFTATACDSYEWHGVVYTQSGVYPYLTQTVHGCDSLELLTLTIHYSDTAYFTATACDSYEWHGQVYTQSGVYPYRTQTVHGCDSLELLTLTIHYSDTAYFTATACDSYEWHGVVYTQSGVYPYLTQTVHGCDSLELLSLTIHYSDTAYFTATACDSYEWHGVVYTQSGVYPYLTQTVHGCDSLELLNLTIHYSDTAYFTATACDNYEWHGVVYTQSGVYPYLTQTVHGCDSLELLDLTIHYSDTAYFTATACDSYEWHGQVYTQSGVYPYLTQTVHGCDSLELLDLTIHYSDTAYFTATACDSYEWHGVVYTQSGLYPYLTQTVYGCDSLELLTLTIHYSDTAYFTATACDSYEWHGVVYTQSGVYPYLTQTVHGCDSLELLDLTIHYSDTAYFTATACDSYEWHGQVYTQSGVYPYLTQTVYGCDSLELLDLTIHYSDTAYFTATACDSYEWHGVVYTQSGVYPYLTQTVHGCDSLELLNLTIHYSDTAYFTATACDSYEWHGVVYTQSGVYPYLTQTVHGCDSLELLNLTIHYSDTAYFTATACDSYEWHGVVYTQSGVYPYRTQTVHGCDSLELLTLTIHYSDTAYFTATACDSYEWHGIVYTQSGVYPYLTQTVHGCDSLELLDLTIHYSDTAYFTATACDSYEWHGVVYTQSGVYPYLTQTVHGCDSLELLDLTIHYSEVGATEYATICYGDTYTWNGQTYSTTGEYSITLSNTLGCDSVATLELTILPEAVITEESATINEEYLPYIWRGQSYYATGTYTITEPFANYTYCDSAVHLLHLTVEALNKSGDNLYWHYKNDTLTFTGSGAMYDNPDMLSYRNESWYPARVNHVILSTELTHIGNVAFADCANLTQIVIPNSVNSIGDGAFSWTGLQSVTIPASVTELGEQVFEACNNLHTIIYEGYPTVISNQAIHPLIGCVHLDTVIAPAALWHCTNADKALENRYGVPHKARYIEVTDGLLTNQAIKYIAQNATALEVLDLTNTTNTTLPYGAFSHSYLLTQLYLPAYIETLPESMIEGGNRLMEITIPATVTEIGNYAFAGCVNIWRMTVEATTPPKVYENTFDGISRSISVLVPAGSEQAYREAEYWREFFIDNTNSPLPISNCQKILREDQILILRDGRTYTIMGAEIK